MLIMFNYRVIMLLKKEYFVWFEDIFKILIN